jgi:hypothetical protein
MPSIRDRDDINAKRSGRLSQLKIGPGFFVYNGKGIDIETIPTVLKTGKKEPAYDASGMPLIDSSGRQKFRPAGKVKYKKDGSPLMGGPPKIIKHRIKIFKIWGYDFPIGEKVFVKKVALARKLRGMDTFIEVEENENPPKINEPEKEKVEENQQQQQQQQEDKKDPEKLEDLSWQELRGLAQTNEIPIKSGTKKEDLIASLKENGLG